MYGESSKSGAQISRDLSAYIWGNVPTREIDQNILWLEQVRFDCDFKIRSLQQLKKDRERSKNYKAGLNELASQFYDEIYADMPIETIADIIFQRLDITRKNAQVLAEKIKIWAKNERQKNRNKRIMIYLETDMTITDIARKVGLSRQYVSKIVNEGRKNRL